MGEWSKIGWTDHSVNFWRGCTKVSRGCTNCYAEAQSVRNQKVLGYWGPHGPRVVGAPNGAWLLPGRLDRAAAAEGVRRRVFVNSLSDFFEQYDGPLYDHRDEQLYRDHDGEWTTRSDWADAVALPALTLDDVRVRALEVMNTCPRLDFQVLTKRPESILPTLRRLADWRLPHPGRSVAREWLRGHYPPNVWLGTSVEDGQVVGRIDHLRQATAACRFLSLEPLLGPLPGLDLTGIHWVIVGGESDNGGRCQARPCRLEWIRDLVGQCRQAGVPVFVKQLGSEPERGLDLSDMPDDVKLPLLVNDKSGVAVIRLGHPKGEDLSEWPTDLRVRQFPVVGV